ncbi:MAG: class I SAM-dependent methyltransferase [Mariprofundaceae bacterium]|nr:class I SAM-dependent methyltransferase [Mariprofundaceae bacterium]
MVNQALKDFITLHSSVVYQELLKGHKMKPTINSFRIIWVVSTFITLKMKSTVTPMPPAGRHSIVRIALNLRGGVRSVYLMKLNRRNSMNTISNEDKMSLDATLEGAVISLKNSYPNISGHHLDIGSGTGKLIRRIQQEYDVQSNACDYTEQFMELENVKVDVVDLNNGKLPYSDNHFDLINFY